MIAASSLRPLLALLVAAVVACSGADLGQSDTSRAKDDSTAATRTPIFRYVQLNAGRAVLGDTLPDSVRTAIGAQRGDTLIALPRGTFAGAERITLMLTREGVVRGAVFDYILTADFDVMVAEYASDFGPPVRTQEQRGAEVPADVATWQDAQTMLVVRRDPNRSAWTVRTVLRDRALDPR